MRTQFRFQPYRLFAYERELARREIVTSGLSVIGENRHVIAAEGTPDPARLRRLTYFRSIENGHVRVTPDLAYIEERHLATRYGEARPRQATRYLVHGLHEYKGKFNPQIVRAFCNILGFRPGDLLIDPFCGSGTSLVEALSLDGRAAGVDLSPLAVFVSRAKVAAFTHRDPGYLAEKLRDWIESASAQIASAQEHAREDANGFQHLQGDAVEYLRGWFTPPALAGLSVALRHLRDLLHDKTLYLIAAVTLSSILRDVSLQLPEDLRVRRRPDDFIAPSLAIALREAALETVRALQEVAAAPRPTGTAHVEHGSSMAPDLLESLRGDASRACTVTSPPYATALPYIDTDRLSLVALGLARPPELRRLEASLIGSREWDTQEQHRWFEALESDEAALPREIVELCRRIRARNGSAGFRRQAVPGLLYRYFVLLRETLEQLRRALRPSEGAVFIVGYNRTRTATQTILIDTPKYLGLVAEQRGFAIEEILSLETWPRYGLHHENGVQGEAAVILRAR